MTAAGPLPTRRARPFPLAAITGAGRYLFAAAVIAIGIENFWCARAMIHLAPGTPPRFPVIPVVPWLAAQPALGWALGVVLVVCGVGLLIRTWARWAGLIAGAVFFVAALGFDAARYAAFPRSMGLRTLLFEPLAIGALAWLAAEERRVETFATALFVIALVVFGAGHFLALAPTGPNRGIFTSVMPPWLPWPLFWIGLFGVAFILAAISIGGDILRRWGAAGLGAMFGIWVLTLHLPRVLGIYAIPGGVYYPDEISSLLIAVAMWGGAWALSARAVRSSMRS